MNKRIIGVIGKVKFRGVSTSQPALRVYLAPVKIVPIVSFLPLRAEGIFPLLDPFEKGLGFLRFRESLSSARSSTFELSNICIYII